jgi:predicted HTH domain antitoxin
VCKVGFKINIQLAQEAQVVLQEASRLAGFASGIIPK